MDLFYLDCRLDAHKTVSLLPFGNRFARGCSTWFYNANSKHNDSRTEPNRCAALKCLDWRAPTDPQCKCKRIARRGKRTRASPPLSSNTNHLLLYIMLHSICGGHLCIEWTCKRAKFCTHFRERPTMRYIGYGTIDKIDFRTTTTWQHPLESTPFYNEHATNGDHHWCCLSHGDSDTTIRQNASSHYTRARCLKRYK